VERVEDGDAAFHDEGNVAEEGDVGERVARNGDEIGEFAGFDGADGVLLVEKFGGGGGSGANGFERSEAALGQRDQLIGVFALQIGTAGVETAGDFHAKGFGQTHFLVGSLDKFIVAFATLGGELRRAASVGGVHDADGGHEKDAFLFH